MDKQYLYGRNKCRILYKHNNGNCIIKLSATGTNKKVNINQLKPVE